MKAKGAGYYNKVFRESPNYQCPKEESSFYPLWQAALELLHTLKVKEIVDLGCGAGQFGEMCFQAGIGYTGVDFSFVAIKMAGRRVGNLHFHHTQIESFLNYAWKYPCYVLLEVLEHLDKDIETLKLIPPDAMVVFSVPNYDAEGHTRFFETMEKAVERYSTVIKLGVFVTIETGEPGNRIFLLAGRKL